jgi:hypothetical protein
VLGTLVLVLGAAGLSPAATSATSSSAPLKSALLLGLLACSLATWGLVEQVGGSWAMVLVVRELEGRCSCGGPCGCDDSPLILGM